MYVSYDYRDAFGLLILILVLLFRPQGLARREGARGMSGRAQPLGQPPAHRTSARRSRSWRCSPLVPLFVTTPYSLGILIVSIYFALLALGWNLLAGFTGQFSLAPAAFAMLGAYATALLDYHLKVPLAIGIPAAIVGTALLGWLLGRVVLRLKGPYLALTTLSFAEIARVVIGNSHEFTRGDQGLNVPDAHSKPRRATTTFSSPCSLAVLLRPLPAHARARRALLARDPRRRDRARRAAASTWCATRRSPSRCRARSAGSPGPSTAPSASW